MDKFIIRGGTPLRGEVTVGGAKNVALKALVASLLTDEEIIVHNIPRISDVSYMLEVLQGLGVTARVTEHTVWIKNGELKSHTVPLEVGAKLRTSSMVLGPLLARWGSAKIPNPGGCRIGTRPIDRHIGALQQMGAKVHYDSSDGFFHARASGLKGTEIVFPKNTHTGTETLILAAVLAQGTTILHNAAAEVEIDDLIGLLNRMGAQIKRKESRTIVISGVPRLHGAEYTIMPDRNEEVTFALAAAVTRGEVVVRSSQRQYLGAFHAAFVQAGGTYEAIDTQTTRYGLKDDLRATDIITHPYPAFMTDWQAPWAVLMTQAQGKSTIHETVFESRFSYVEQLRKMGAKIAFYQPKVDNPREFYNFNWADRSFDSAVGIVITGPTPLHNAVVDIDDLRAGATLILAALAAQGESYIHGVDQVDRGYENIEVRLRELGAVITRLKEEQL